MAPVWLSRMTYTGDLGYEIWCAPEYQRYLFDLLWEAGQPHGMALFGFRALITMRLEKHFGTWFREYRPIYTPLEAGMDRYLKFDHEFIGREAVEAELAGGGPQRRMVMFEVDVDESEPADVIGDEPVWLVGGDGDDDRVVGWITSGGYAHYCGPLAGVGLRPGRARRRVAGLRDRDHRQAPPGAHPEGAGGRPRRTPNARLSDAYGAARRRRPPGAAARCRRALPRRARPGERVAAPDGAPARGERQRPRPPLRLEGRPDRGRPAALGGGAEGCRGAVAGPSPAPLAGRPVARVVAVDHGQPAEPGGGAARHRGGGARRHGHGPAAPGARRPDRHLARQHRAAPARRGCGAVDGDGRGVTGEGDVHRPRRRPAGDRPPGKARHGHWSSAWNDSSNSTANRPDGSDLDARTV